MEIFNEYNVLVNKEIKKQADSIYDDIRSFFLNKPDLTITELMLLQRHYEGMISGIFADRILQKQLKLRKENNSSQLKNKNEII